MRGSLPIYAESMAYIGRDIGNLKICISSKGISRLARELVTGDHPWTEASSDLVAGVSNAVPANHHCDGKIPVKMANKT